MSAPMGCYTTARVERGAVHALDRHVARLLRDAALLGLGRLDPDACRRALVAAAAQAFPDGAGIVRLEATADAGGPTRIGATTRALGPEPGGWRAVIATDRHPGPSPWSAAKTSARAVYERALAEAARAAADEALLLDGERFLVEGARTNLVVVLDPDAPVTPPLARGAQAGIGRAILLERVAALREADVPAAALRAARELVAVNAVRGPRPVLALDGRPVGAGRPGAWAARLACAWRAAGD